MIDFTAYKHPVAAVACPDCGAGVNQRCKRPSEHVAMELHSKRRVLADKIWAEQKSPGIINTSKRGEKWGFGIWKYEAAA